MNRVRWPESSSTEKLILVDNDDQILGFDSKRNVHLGEGKLHRAFSVFVYDQSGALFLHKRSSLKPLWPGFWTNSCCSHPRQGEQIIDAVDRRVFEELGLISITANKMFDFVYHARFHDLGAEHEYCSVFEVVIEDRSAIVPNTVEMSEWGWFMPEEIDHWLARDDEQFSPWFKLEWSKIRTGYFEVA